MMSRQLLLLVALSGALVRAQALVPAQKPKPAVARPAGVPSYKDLKYPPLGPIKIPDVVTATLPNGMKLYLLEDHELPTVNGVALVRTGNLFDPPDKIGLATMTGTVLRSGGTKEKTGDQLDEQLENIAASVESGIGETSGSISFSALKENTDEVMGIFRDVLTAPEFRQDKIDLLKSQLRSSISRRNDEAHAIAAREFASIIYGRDTPYGWRMEYEHVNRISRDDLLAFYKRYFFPGNIMLGVRGDFSAAEMKNKLEKLFGGWTYQQPPVPPFPQVSNKATSGIFLAVKPDVTQTFFELGHLGGVLRDKDFPALQVMADILGGGFSSRLFQRVRTQLGYAYSISANWGANFDHPGIFVVSGSTKSVSTTETIRNVEQEIEKLRASEVSDQELETAKQTVLNSFVFNFDTKAKTLGRLLTYEYYGYPKDFIYQYQKAVQAVTKADILRVAQKHVRAKELVLVAVGNPTEFGQPLSALGVQPTPLDLTIPEAKTEAAKSDAASLERGKQLLQRAQQAIGGADKLAKVNDFVQVSDVQIAPGAGGMKVAKKESWVSPSHFRQDNDLPFGKMSAYSDGQTGWIQSPQGLQVMQGPQLNQVQSGLFRLYFPLLLSDRMPERTVNYVGEGTLEISGKSGHSVKLVIDEKTGLPVKQSYQMPGPRGASADVEEVFGDLKDVNGIKIPHKITTNQAGQKFSEETVREIKLNTGVKVEELSKRP